jgi:MYXO-CTERM domain-containing protein
MLFSGDTDEPTPFEVDFEITSERALGWGQIGFPWESLAEWADEGGPSELDPTRVTGYGFSLGADETSSEGTLWVDDLHISPGAAPPLSIPVATPTAAPTAPGEEPIEEPVEGPGEEEEPEGGLCPFSAVALPLGGLGVLLASRRRR